MRKIFLFQNIFPPLPVIIYTLPTEWKTSLKMLITFIKNSGNMTIIITADHGELLGEDGLWLHPRIHHPKLHEIPWLEIKK